MSNHRADADPPGARVRAWVSGLKPVSGAARSRLYLTRPNGTKGERAVRSAPRDCQTEPWCRTIPIHCVGMIEPFIRLRLRWPFPSAWILSRNEAQGKRTSDRVALAQNIALDTIALDVSVIAAEASAAHATGGEEILAHDRGSDLASVSMPASRCARSADMNMFGRADPDPVLLLFESPTRSPIAARTFPHPPDLGQRG